MNTLNITFDFETCALCPTAAVMSVGAVAWRGDAVQSPFFLNKEGRGAASPIVFYRHVDLRSMFVNGFTFDAATGEWWARQDRQAKQAVLDADECPLAAIDVVISDFFSWMNTVKESFGFDDACLWSQGSDFDIAILKNICHKHDLSLPVCYKNFRDHRTFYMESARIICATAGVDFEPKKAYTLVDDFEEIGVPHNPVYDCKMSIWSTWQIMKHLRCLSDPSKKV